TWVDITAMLNSVAARATLRQQALAFIASDRYRGLMVDFEEFPQAAQPGYNALLAELSNDLHSRGLKLYVSVPVLNPDWDYRSLAAAADGVVLMNYDQHYHTGTPGPLA